MRNLTPISLLTAVLCQAVFTTPAAAQEQAESVLYIWPGRVIEYVERFDGKEKLWVEADAEKVPGVDVGRVEPRNFLGRKLGPEEVKKQEEAWKRLLEDPRPGSKPGGGDEFTPAPRLPSPWQIHIAMTRPGSYFSSSYKDAPSFGNALRPGHSFELSAMLHKVYGPKSSAGLGLYWGLVDNENYSAFMIHGGRVTAGRVTDGKWQGLDWVAPELPDAIEGGFNELSVRFDGQKFELLLNGHAVLPESAAVPLDRGPGKYGIFVGNGEEERADVFVSDFAVRGFPEQADVETAKRALLAMDYGRAAAHLRVLVEKRPTDEARVAFAGLLLQGSGIERDLVRAVGLLEVAAGNGNDRARVLLAQVLLRGAGGAPDPGRAQALLEQAAAGSDDARLLLADILAHGPEQSRDYARARELLEDVAARRSAATREAEYRIGLLYVQGLGVEVNAAKGREWLERAADGLFPQVQALYTLGVLHSRGAFGQVDAQQALACWRRAADRGEPQSMFSLGLAYRQGFGVEADPVEAAKCFLIVAARGSGTPGGKAAEKESEELKAKLSPGDRKRAQTLAQSWLQSH